MDLENERQSLVQSKYNGHYTHKAIGFHSEVASFNLLYKSWQLSKSGSGTPSSTFLTETMLILIKSFMTLLWNDSITCQVCATWQAGTVPCLLRDA